MGSSGLRDTRPFRTEPRRYLPAKKSVFNRVVGEARADGLELAFAAFLEAAADVQSSGKNDMAVGFKLDYVRANGDLSNYIPDFLVRTDDGAVWIVETKGREELDLPQKMARLRQWREDATEASRLDGGPAYGFVYVDQQSFEALWGKDRMGGHTALCRERGKAPNLRGSARPPSSILPHKGGGGASPSRLRPFPP